MKGTYVGNLDTAIVTVGKSKSIRLGLGGVHKDKVLVTPFGGGGRGHGSGQVN